MGEGRSGAHAEGDSRTRPTRTARRRRFVAALVAIDALTILAAALVATWIRFGSMIAPVRFESPELHVSFWQLAFVVVPLWICLLSLSGLYDLDRLSWGLPEPGRIVRSISFGVVVLILATFLAKLPGLSRAWTLLLWVLSILAVMAGRICVSYWFTLMHRQGRHTKTTLVVGSNAESADIVRVLHANVDAGLVPVGVVASSQAERLELDYSSGATPMLGAARDIVSIASEQGADVIVIASSAFDHDVLARIIAELRTADVDVHVSSGLFEVLSSRVLVSEIAGVPLITIKGISLSRGNLLVKRTFDLTVAALIVLIGSPLWVALAATIKLTSPGPVFYGQERVGRDGRRFKMLKFRSMYQDADARRDELTTANEASGPLFKMRDDPRVTPIGRWLRKFSVDEFPQLINVLKGEMSLVGPRPPLPTEVLSYSVKDWRRLEVVPGMTGLWQVSGRSSLTFDEMVALDLFYIENWSVALDLTLLVRTVPAVVFARGAY